jgi:hypothetical protein
MLKYIKYSFEPLYENLKDAKEFMKQRVANRLGKTVAELEPDDQAMALNQPKFKQIEALLASKNSLNYMLPFTRFHFEHGAKINGPLGDLKNWEEISENPSLEKLLAILLTDRNLVGQLSMPLDKYAAQTNVNGVNPFEAIFDELRTIYRNKAAKWFINVLPVNLRQEFRTAPVELQQEFYNAAHIYKELGGEAIARMVEKIAAFKSWTFMDALAYIKQNLKGYSNANVKRTIALLKELEPQAGMLYFDDGYMVLSMRTEHSQKELCSIANWCINRGSFAGYVANRVQINIFNFNLDHTDPMFLIGVTPNYDKTIHASHDINDKSIVSGKTVDTHLLALGYPQELVDEVYKRFDQEIVIKKIVYSLSLGKGDITPAKLLEKINQAGNSFPEMPDEETMNTIFKIVEESVESKIDSEDIIKAYSKTGILNQLAAVIFKRLSTRLSREEVAQIVETSMKNFAMIDKISTTRPQLLNPVAKNILSQKDLVLDQLSQF